MKNMQSEDESKLEEKESSKKPERPVADETNENNGGVKKQIKQTAGKGLFDYEPNSKHESNQKDEFFEYKNRNSKLNKNKNKIDDIEDDLSDDNIENKNDIEIDFYGMKKETKPTEGSEKIFNQNKSESKGMVD